MKFVRAEALIARERDRSKPNLGGGIAALDVDMGWFVRFVAVEIQAEAVTAKNGGHKTSWINPAIIPCSGPVS